MLSLSGAVVLPSQSAAAAGADITASVLADADVTLSGPSIIHLPAGTTTYNGVFSGQGTLTITGSGTLVLTHDSDFTLPSSEQNQSLTRSGGSPSYPIISDPDQPAVIVASGATLQYGDGGSTGVIGDYPYPAIGGVTLNHDNIEVDGTLDLDLTNREYNLGTITGSGLISQPRFTWNTLDLVGAIPFSGTISNGTGMNFGNVTYRLSLPSVSAVDNDGSAVISARDYTLVLSEDFYEDHYGDDINFHTWQDGLIEMTGVDHYVNPSLDRTSIAHGANYRGINIGSANVQWGDGSTDRFFLPALPSNSYINVQNGALTFDYDGPVTLDTPISGGTIHDSLGAPADASVTLAATNGNAVTFAVPMNYHGATTIGPGATLLLGTSQSGGDSSLLAGASNDEIVDDGMLIVRNTSAAITLANINGAGGLTQAGTATTTLSGTMNYTGATTISSGTLALTGHVSTLGGTWRVQHGTLAIDSGGTLDASSLIQSADSTLSFAPGAAATSPQGAPLQFSGAVQLGGTLSVASVPAIPVGGEVVLVHDTGTQPITGTFTGLPQGAHLSVGGRQYTVDYEGDSGHDVVLSTGAATGAAASNGVSESPRTVTGTASGSAGSAGSSTMEIAGAVGAAVLAVIGGIVLAIKHRVRSTPRPGSRRRHRK